ncbi:MULTISPECIES: hypothetical protein [unclassified Streptomyces]|uniref:hypothetical protein n=1 Tax=unclassified Streptomyces TaxID=2593676 RepID=UPI002E81F93D|nr:hypothetical protein [Streptomyces sp. NBC_00589]WTI38637.1 hypothetical protein OIC96_28435 [Streptomyces sp. NBC_00775]WUB27684.1 hypothetical protein OHA51_21300 [Streptomyces sp. NBC_00589]
MTYRITREPGASNAAVHPAGFGAVCKAVGALAWTPRPANSTACGQRPGGSRSAATASST